MTFAAGNTRTVPLGPCIRVTGMSEKSAGDPECVVRGGVVVRRERRIGRPLLEINGLAHWGAVASFRSSALAVERGQQAIELARRHGWSGEPLVAVAYPMLAGSLICQGELEGAERWLMEGEYALQSDVEPATGMLFHLVRGFLEIARGRVEAALVLEASARDALGEREAAGRALERGLDLAESDGLLFPFLLHPVPELLERHARQRTAHAALIWKIISVLGARTPAAPAGGPPTPAAPPAGPPEHLPKPLGPPVHLPEPLSPPEHLPEPLSQAEARVLRFLPTSLSAPEIARELYVSVNTIRTHMRHLYDKLGAHRRLEAIDRARALGLLAPVPQRTLSQNRHARITPSQAVPLTPGEAVPLTPSQAVPPRRRAARRPPRRRRAAP